MSEFELIPQERPAMTSVFYILVTTIIGFYVIGPLIGAVLATPFLGGSFETFRSNLTEPLLHPEIKTAVMIVQGSAAFFGLIVGPSLYWFAFERKNVLELVRNYKTPGLAFLLTAVAVVAFTVPNSILVNWNANITFPDFLKEFGDWVKQTEGYAEKLTQFFTEFKTGGEFILTFVIIAVLPGIGEELVFRGMLQPKIHQATRNVHAAIWISAALFSLMHLQFLGFVPRMFLGAFFGYLYAWSGNLLIPITAHFVNNGFAVILLYLYRKGTVTVDVESTEVLPWPALIVGTIVTFVSVALLKKLLGRNSATT